MVSNKLKGQAQQVFETYPNENVVLATEDGMFFLPKNRNEAISHASTTKQDIHTIRRDELVEEEETPEDEDLTNEDLWKIIHDLDKRLIDSENEKEALKDKVSVLQNKDEDSNPKQELQLMIDDLHKKLVDSETENVILKGRIAFLETENEQLKKVVKSEETTLEVKNVTVDLSNLPEGKIDEVPGTIAPLAAENKNNTKAQNAKK